MATAQGTATTLLLSLGLLLAACGGSAESPSEGAAPPDREGASGSASVSQVDMVTVDRSQMDTEACHMMEETIMGKCTKADIDELLGDAELVTVDLETMSDQECHVMDATIMGKCSDEDIKRLRRETVIVVDKQEMSADACHRMENWIMGACSEEEVQRLAEEIRAEQSES